MTREAVKSALVMVQKKLQLQIRMLRGWMRPTKSSWRTCRKERVADCLGQETTDGFASSSSGGRQGSGINIVFK